MRDERIWTVYLLPHGNAAVFDLYGDQMPQDQDPDARGLLETAYPRRLWHEWLTPQRCRCGLALGDHTRPRDEPPLQRHTPASGGE